MDRRRCGQAVLQEKPVVVREIILIAILGAEIAVTGMNNYAVFSAVRERCPEMGNNTCRCLEQFSGFPGKEHQNNARLFIGNKDAY